MVFPLWNPMALLTLGTGAVKPAHKSGPKPGFGAGAHVEIAWVVVICKPSILGWARTRLMTATRPRGGSVFLVEDEVMIRMMVAEMLEELGYSIAAEAGEINEAIRLAQSTEFDLAILDVNVNGKVISPVADLIKARNRPFIFATGYGSSGLPEEYRDRPALQKPFQIETLARVIDNTLKSAAT
jgi:CheY-like chemotaxis protein